MKMKDDVRTHKIKVEEKENMWRQNCKHEENGMSGSKNKKKRAQEAERLKWHVAMHVVLMLNIRAHVNMHSLQVSSCRTIHPPHLAAMSSSSPPQPQYWLGKPFIFMYWSGVTADTPPKYCGYGSLGGSHQQCKTLKIMSQHNTFIQNSTLLHTHCASTCI